VDSARLPQESGLYYLQSRYYDPNTGRFLNADALISTGQGLLGNNMFAYCNDNPTNGADPSGCINERINPHYMVCEAPEGGWPIVPVRDKYTKINGMICGQGVFSSAQENMALGTYANNGCGIIAIYNAMQLLGKPKSLGSIEDIVALCGGMVLGGIGGIMAEAIGAYFTLQGVPWFFYSSYSKLSQHIYEDAVVVFMAKTYQDGHFSGFHFMTAQYIEGKYLVYNLYNNSVGPLYADSLAIVGNTTWLCGYIVGGQT